MGRHRVIWLTGLSGAGKTTIARAAAEKFGCHVLDGDDIRDMFQNTDFTPEGRERHLLGVAKLAAMMSEYTDVICSFITPYEHVREKILRILPPSSVMVHVSTPLEVCEARDVKGLYAKARAGEISSFTGISDPFDEPKCAHLALNSDGMDGRNIDDLVGKFAPYFGHEPVVFLPGRWQPLHLGHEWLVQQELDKGKRVILGVRDTPISESNPFSAKLRKEMIDYRYRDENVEAWIMPDIEAIAYGRNVGYEVRETGDIPSEVFAISATGVRKGKWSHVSTEVYDFLEKRGLAD